MDRLDDELDDQIIRQLLDRYDEPTLIATPQTLVSKVRGRLPQQPPAQAARAAWQAQALGRIGGVLALLALLALFGLGSWSVLVDSSLPLRLLADSGVGEVLLILALVVKPLLGVIAAQTALLIGLMIGLLLVGGFWWRLLQRAPAYDSLRVRR